MESNNNTNYIINNDSYFKMSHSFTFPSKITINFDDIFVMRTIVKLCRNIQNKTKQTEKKTYFHEKFQELSNLPRHTNNFNVHYENG